MPTLLCPHHQGHFRLAFQFQFLRALGHQWVLQWDSDSYAWEHVRFNLITHMRDKGYWVADKPMGWVHWVRCCITCCMPYCMTLGIDAYPVAFFMLPVHTHVSSRETPALFLS